MPAEPLLDTDLLRAFVAVAETGSFTAAAEVIGRSQSAVSQKVIRLEEMLERSVFARTSRSLRLTPDGERLLVVARQMLALNDDFLRSLRRPSEIGTLRLGISENLVPTQLPRLLSRFFALHPSVHLELSTGLSAELLARHKDGKLDAVVALSQPDAPARGGRVLWREPLVWIAAADHEPDPNQPLRLVVMRPPCTYRAAMTDALDRVRRDWVTACTASSLAGLQAALMAGMGVTALGESFLHEGVRTLRGDRWPALPVAEMTVVGEDGPAGSLVRELSAFLADGLIGGAALSLAA
ncbi:LysR substrate-binding domain-containing protein [Sphingomonas sp. PR090111-T3T-6A]|uniref:LysR substrate-binding domain-containing protein n=1 Tax=Sphingomonas sp. PR090111-T3T-6A TaxID=685778 RepID=UPI000378A55F|nr:LysR substrate-binding domain-containing protein [Sphingomonas sp. PR090111-T3T-6A]